MRCPLCHDIVEPVVTVRDVPVLCNVLARSRGAARAAARGDVVLGVCAGCGAGRNLAFDPGRIRYDAGYENSLHGSAVFRAYARRLAGRLVAEHALDGACIVEIGAGRGEFLAELCAAAGGTATAVGIDPGRAADGCGRGPGREPGRVHLVGAIDDLDPPPEADLVVARHVLEHVDDPGALLRAAASLAPRVRRLALYLEVPSAEHMYATDAVFDLVYEHPWYFSAAALTRLAANAGFTVRRTGRAFDGQYLFLDAVAGPASDPPDGEPDGREVLDEARRFGARAGEVREEWARRLAAFRARGARVALWGAGSKGVTFLNWVPGAAHVERVVDVNVRKHGRFVPGTGHVVESPEVLAAQRVDVVVLPNIAYETEVADRLAASGVEAELVVVEPRRATSW